MTRTPDNALLPNGLQDLLAPDAAHEASAVERLMHCFAAHGYERVKPPMLEFESALLAGAGAALGSQTFRLMDPVSQKMLGLRADVTPQVARIAASRLAHAPRPLRLCYAGQVLRTSGSQLRPERQFAQVGAELIGTDAEAADAEAVTMAVEALQEVGVPHLSVDLNLPPLVGALAAHLGLDEDTTEHLRQALDRKDSAAVDALAGDRAELFRGLLRAVGPAETALPRLQALDLPAAIRPEAERLARVVERVRATLPELTLTVDPVEHRGFEYQTGVSFTLYARGVRAEVGRGGRYTADANVGGTEAATGFTVFMDTVMRALPAAPRAERLYLPAGTDPAVARGLRADGWVTVSGLDPETDAAAEAARQGCGHIYRDGRVAAVPTGVGSG